MTSKTEEYNVWEYEEILSLLKELFEKHEFITSITITPGKLVATYDET